MTVEDWEPVDYLAEFRERETGLREVKELLTKKAHRGTGKMWAHHLPQMLDQLDFFRGLLQDEIDHYGEWRYHGFQPDEALEIIDQDLDEISDWLSRMMSTSPATPPAS